MHVSRARVLAVVAASLAVHLAVVGCSPRAPEPQPSSVATAPAAQTVEHILGFGLPTDIASIVATLGPPSSIELPDLEEDPSPWGQWFRWGLPDSLTFTALADDYSDTRPNYAAGVRLVELMADQSTSATSTVYGFRLNETRRDEVMSRFGDRLQRSTGGAGYDDALKFSHGDTFTYFIFDRVGRLVGVSQSVGVDPDTAD